MRKSTYQSKIPVFQERVPYRVILLGGFETYGSGERSDGMNSFLKAHDIVNGYRRFEHNGVTFEFFVLRDFDKLQYKSLFAKSSIVLMIPDSIEDFNFSANILDPYVSSHQQTVHFHNAFAKGSLEHTMIEKKANFYHFSEMPGEGSVLDRFSALAKQPRTEIKKDEQECTIF